MKRKAWSQLGLAAAMGVWAAFAAGCSNEGDSGGGHAGHGHRHDAPHGGALAMLGNHALQLELLPDPEAGQLKLYVLDGGAEHFVRIAAPALMAYATQGERSWYLRFQAVGNPATGETVGDTAYFVAEAPELADEPRFEIRFERIEARGQSFESVRIPYPEGVH